MTSATRPVALIDTNVLYSAGVRDILLQTAVAELYEPKWSPDIGSEFLNTFRKIRPDIEQKRIERIWAEMNHFFPKALITGYEFLVDRLTLPDPNDRHVLAAAIHAGCDYIITDDRKHFPADVLETCGIIGLRPDDFLLMLLHSNPVEIVHAVSAILARLKNPSYSVEAYLDMRIQDGLENTVNELRIFAHLLA